jgi:hypothetical protein
MPGLWDQGGGHVDENVSRFQRCLGAEVNRTWLQLEYENMSTVKDDFQLFGLRKRLEGL